MSEVQHNTTSFTSVEEEDLAEYRAFSPLAVIALLLGMFSALALANLLLLIFPLIAALVALVAIRRIDRSEGSLTGRPVALIALALAILFAATALSRYAARTWTIRSQAQQFAEDWLQLVRQEELYQAHQLHLPLNQRQLPGTSLKEYYENNTAARQQVKTLFAKPPLDKLVEIGDSGSVKFLRVKEHVTGDGRDQLSLLFSAATNSEPHPQHISFLVIVERQTVSEETPQGFWYFVGAALPEKI